MIDASGIPAEKRLDYIDKSLNQKRSVKLRTCADVYGHWRQYKRSYKRAPQEGVEFQIDYIDTEFAFEEHERASAPIALLLHGAPGSYHDFALLIQHLSRQKVRVIAPNFPEYIATVKTKVLFRHSADEKAAYLRDFLQAIQVSKIDLLVSHSSAIFPTLLILLNANKKALGCNELEDERPASAIIDYDNQRNLNLNHTQNLNKDPNQDQRQFDESNRLVKELESLSGREEQSDMASHLGGTEEEDSGTGSVELTEDTFEDASDELELDGNDSNNNEDVSLDSGAKRRQHQEQSDGFETVDLNQNYEQSIKQTIPNEGPVVEASEEQTYDAATTTTITTTKGGQGNKSREFSSRRTEVIVKFEHPIEIKAVALLNPAGHRLPMSMKPAWFKCGSVPIYQRKLGRSLYRKLGPTFLTIIGVPVRVDNMDNVMLSATVMRNSRCQRVREQLKQLSEMKIPTLLVFSENDKLIEREIFYEMTQFMKLNPKNFDIFNDDGDIELSQSVLEDWIRVMVFKAGGHYAYSNYAKTVNQAISELLDRVRKDNSPAQ